MVLLALKVALFFRCYSHHVCLFLYRVWPVLVAAVGVAAVIAMACPVYCVCATVAAAAAPIVVGYWV